MAQGKGTSSIYLGKDSHWHGRVTVGTKDDGSPDRRHTMHRDRAEVVKRVKKLEKLRDEGTVPRTGRVWTVAQWLQHWLDNVAAPHIKANTLSGYRVAVHTHLIPALGKHRLDKLEPEHLERFYGRMLATTTRRGTPTKPATVHQVHRTLRTALNEAVRRGHLAKNPALIARPPRVDDHDVEPFTLAEIQAIFTAAGAERNGARWVLALALGLRQGEALGLRWTDVDLNAQTLHIQRGRLRPTYAHGCAPDCGHKYAGYCPNRRETRAQTDTTKSRAGRRKIGLPAEVCDLLRQHRAVQEQERRAAHELWHECPWVFATETGAPINPRTDWSHWKQLLKTAGVRDGRLHDARHTAATVLLLLGVSERAIMDLMGWSTTAMAGRYAHMIDPIRSDVASRVSGYLWPATGTPTTT